MHKPNLPWIVGIASLLFTGFLVASLPTDALSVASHIVISEVQVGNVGAATDEFVELYNPTLDTIDLTGWELRRKTASGSSETALVSSISGSIAPRSYFLIAHPNYTGSVSADMSYPATSSSGITANNTVVLRDAESELVDKVGMGTALDSETSATTSPDAGTSIERKANNLSTGVSMDIGGTDESGGNGEDTDNNGADFVTRALPQPQNSQSSVEPIISPSPSPSPTAEPSASPSIEPSASPSAEPSASPSIEPSASPSASPSVSPTPEPSVSPSPSPEVSPSPSPSATPSPTPSPSPSVSPTPLPSASASPSPVASSSPSPSPAASVSPSPSASPSSSPQIIFQNPFLTCRVHTLTIRTFFGNFSVPFVRCAPTS